MNAPIRNRAVFFAVFGAFMVAGCARSDESGAGDSAATASAPAGDTGMAGMDHSQMPGMNREAAKDADHEFLRMMSDHHEGMLLMLNGAPDKATSATAKADARMLLEKQSAERDSMLAMIKMDYNETLTAMPMQSAKTMAAELQGKTGAAYDRDMYRHVIMHHQEGVKMADDFLPRLKKAEVRQMAEKMKADQQREIADFQRKQTG